MKKNLPKTKQRGVIAIITLFGVTTFALAIITTLTDLALDELKMANAGSVIDETYYAAEAGLNQGLYRMIQDSSLDTYSMTINGIDVQITISSSPSSGYSRIVQAQATGTQGNTRTVQVVANTSSFAGGFDYAVQGGSGGVYLDNNSTVIGDVYSNGQILPASGGLTNHIVTGNAWSATNGTDLGFIDGVEVGGDAHAHTIARSEIAGDAYYFEGGVGSTIDTATDVNGSPCNPTLHANCHPGALDPGIRNFPITPADVAQWQIDEFTLADQIFPDPDNCPSAGGYDDGTYYCVNGVDEIIGQKYIRGNLYVGNGATLTLSGDFLWVEKDIIFDNNGTVQVKEDALCVFDADGDGYDDEVYNTAIVMADGKVDVSNNYTFTGCANGDGDTVSGIIIISTRSDGIDNNGVIDASNPDVYASNNSDSIIFSAINGLLKVKNNGALNAAAAVALFLEPGSTVTFNPLLASFVIGNGGGEEVGTSPGSWQEL